MTAFHAVSVFVVTEELSTRKEMKKKKNFSWKLKYSGFGMLVLSDIEVLLFGWLYHLCSFLCAEVCDLFLEHMNNAHIGRVELTKCPKTRGTKQRRECETLAERLLAGRQLINPPTDTQVCDVFKGLCQMSNK